jgi:hypothetical protein
VPTLQDKDSVGSEYASLRHRDNPSESLAELFIQTERTTIACKKAGVIGREPGLRSPTA